MASRDLRAFAALLEHRGQLHRVPTPVATDGEIAEVAARVGRRRGPALLFEQVDGRTAPVLVGAFAASERVAWALGAEHLDDLRERFGELLGLARVGVGGGVGGTIKALGELAQLGRLAPRRVERGRVHEVVPDRPDLTRLPAPTYTAGGAPLLSLALLIARDPSGARSATTVTAQVADARTLVLPAQPSRGPKTPALIVLGADPAAIYTGLAPLPSALDPFLFAGFLRRAPLDIVRARTVDLEAPAAAEHVLEGELCSDGTFQLARLTHRKGAMLLAASSASPSPDESWLSAATERLFLPLLRLTQPEIVDVVAPTAGSFRDLVLVAIRKEYAGQALKVAAGLFGLAPTMFARAIVVLDQDVDLRDPAACARRVLAEVDWRRDVLVLEGPTDLGAASKIGIDATRDPGAAAPPPLDVAPEVQTLVDRKWASYGVPF